MLQLAQATIRLTRSSSRIVHRPLPQDDPVRRRPDISLARRELGWDPGVSLETGLPRTIAYFKERLDRSDRP